MILWLKTEVEIEAKIQELKTQFRRERKELVDSQRSGNSPKKRLDKINQLDVTVCFIAFMILSTCFGHFYAHHQEL